MRHRLGFTAIGLLLVLACGPAGMPVSPLPAGTASPTAAPPVGESARPPPPPATMPADGLLERSAQLALADLASRLRVPAEQIELIRAERITWPDGSLGCPQADTAYTQAVVEGYRVILGDDGRIYVYHAGADGQPFLCESDEPDGGYDFVPPPGFED